MGGGARPRAGRSDARAGIERRTSIRNDRGVNMSAYVLRALWGGVAFVLLVASVPILNGQTTYYVDGSCGDDAWTGLNPVCQAPDGPKRRIQHGIDAAVNGDTVIVADWTYTGERNKNLDFAGKAITVRSANGPQNCIIDCEANGRGFYFHSGEPAGAVVDGFTVTDGLPRFNVLRGYGGAGIYCRNSSPTILNCILRDNLTRGGFSSDGGGIFCEQSDVTIRNCSIIGNRAHESAEGAGIYCNESDVTISGTLITQNSASGSGAGIYTRLGTVVITDCIIIENTALNAGGGIYSTNTNLLVSRCTIAGNWAERIGGVSAGSFATITNSLIVHNSAAQRTGGVEISTSLLINCTIVDNDVLVPGWLGGGVRAGSNSEIINCNVWNNWPRQIELEGLGQRIVYCNIERGWVGKGNISVDPQFVDPDGPDNNRATWQDNDYHLMATSPSKDTGDPDCVPGIPKRDIDKEYRVWNGRVDMGFDEVESVPVVLGDMNCDFVLNGADIDPFFVAVGDPAGYSAAFPCCDPRFADMNADGAVNGADIDPFFACLGGNCP